LPSGWRLWVSLGRILSDSVLLPIFAGLVDCRDRGIFPCSLFVKKGLQVPFPLLPSLARAPPIGGIKGPSLSCPFHFPQNETHIS